MADPAFKSPHMTGKPLPVVVCDAIRHYQGEITLLEQSRRKAFDDRDQAAESKRRLKNRSSREYAQASIEHSNAVLEIETLSEDITWYRHQLKAAIEKSNSTQTHFDFVFTPPKDDEEDQDQMEFGEDAKSEPLPVGRPVGRPGPVKPAAPDPSKATGVHEHLKASVNELDCPEVIKGKLFKAKLNTIADVVRAIDSKRDLTEAVGLTVRQDEQLAEAVGAYRAKHLKADLEAGKPDGKPDGKTEAKPRK